MTRVPMMQGRISETLEASDYITKPWGPLDLESKAGRELSECRR